MSLPKSYYDICTTIGVWPDWTERRVTRSGIRRLLMLAWRSDGQSTITGEPEWLRLWKQVQWVRFTARHRLHVTIPPKLWAEDKARLAAKIAATTDIRFEEERKRALRWTRR